MSRLTRFLSSTIGQKYLIGATGLLLCGFLVTHLAGNLNVFFGPDAFNGYAAKLHALGPILTFLEIGLFATFAIHIVTAVALAAANRAARGPRGYETAQTKQEQSALNPAPRAWMLVSGTILLAYLIYHLAGMKLGMMDARPVISDPAVFTATDPNADLGPKVNDSGETAHYRRVVGILRSPLSAAVYVVGVVLLGFHLSHGAASSFRSLGIVHPRYTPWIERLGIIFAVVLAVGFASIPLYILLFDVGAATGAG